MDLFFQHDEIDSLLGSRSSFDGCLHGGQELRAFTRCDVLDLVRLFELCFLHALCLDSLCALLFAHASWNQS